MILVADGGSTGVQWAKVADGTVKEVWSTAGMNPHTTTEGQMVELLRGVVQRMGEPSSVYFYGAGCGTEESKSHVASAIHTAMPSASVEVEGDMLGACRALCGDGRGMVGILGTGSNVCVYDGSGIVEQGVSLGYLLGDEGSGNHIGRLLLKCYLSGGLSLDLSTMFHDTYTMDRPTLINRLYGDSHPNRYMASFVPFVAQNKSHPFMQELLHRAFMEFFTQQVIRLSKGGRTISLAGSVAYVFRDEVSRAAECYGIEVAQVVKEPIAALAAYHIGE